MCLGENSIWDRCSVGIHKHPAHAGWVTALGLVVLCGVKGRTLLGEFVEITLSRCGQELQIKSTVFF